VGYTEDECIRHGFLHSSGSEGFQRVNRGARRMGFLYRVDFGLCW
jgi:hypothetical protein